MAKGASRNNLKALMDFKHSVKVRTERKPDIASGTLVRFYRVKFLGQSSMVRLLQMGIIPFNIDQ